MKELKLYICEICKRQYHDKEVAIGCEKKHLIVESVTEPKYDPSENKSEYPESVLIHFKGGKSARYTRKG